MPADPTGDAMMKLEAGVEASSGQSTAPPPDAKERAFAVALYGCTSISITFFNKALFAVYEFNCPSLMTTIQILFSLTFLHVLGGSGVIEMPRFSRGTARKILPMAGLWWLYVVAGVVALRYVSVPIFGTLRRSTTLCVMAGEYLLLNTVPATEVIGAIVLMVGGAVIAGSTDMAFSLPGYTAVAICVVSTAGYLLLLKVNADRKLSAWPTLYYNNLLSLPLMLTWLVFFTDDLAVAAKYPYLYNPKFQLLLVAACSQAFLLNYAIFRCTQVNSPLATSVTGQCKDVVTLLLGLVLFQSTTPSSTNLFGLFVSLSGGLAYGWIKARKYLK